MNVGIIGAGARLFDDGKEIEITEINDEDISITYVPEVSKNDPFNAEISHFVDCCLKKAECICPVDEAVRLMEIIDAIYKSADTGSPVIF